MAYVTSNATSKRKRIFFIIGLLVVASVVGAVLCKLQNDARRGRVRAKIDLLLTTPQQTGLEQGYDDLSDSVFTEVTPTGVLKTADLELNLWAVFTTDVCVYTNSNQVIGTLDNYRLKLRVNDRPVYNRHSSIYRNNYGDGYCWVAPVVIGYNPAETSINVQGETLTYLWVFEVIK